MNRAARVEVARQTLAALDAGEYAMADGARVSIRAELDACLAATRLYEPEELGRLAGDDRPAPRVERTRLEVRNETTLAGIARLHAGGLRDIAALNFASARMPGGGFQSGSQAQEESLARSSGLYASLMRAWPYYERHRQAESPLYTDAAILSPRCPVFRDDAGALLPRPQLVTFVTCAAPNAGAIAQNAPAEIPRIPAVLARRAERVLALAAASGAPALVLGAWGCGVFRNDPVLVAGTFQALLFGPSAWSRHFTHVVFSAYDTSPALETFGAFERAFAGQAVPS